MHVTIEAGGKTTKMTVNEQDTSGAALLGTFQLRAGKSVQVTVSNAGTNGHVVLDGLQLRKP